MIAPLLLLLALATQPAQVLDRSPAPTVGVEGRLDVVLPHGDLAPAPADARADVIVRVADVRPWGTGFRYDLRYVTATPGAFDLARELRRPDGTVPADVPALPITSTGLLAQQHDGALVGLPGAGGRRWPWYAVAAGGAVALWALLLVPIVLVGRKRKKVEHVEPPPAPPTLAERLRPLVEAAAAGTLDADGRGRLERLLLGAWRGKLGLRGDAPAALVRTLRGHAEAGPLVAALESWLHRPPDVPRPSDAEIGALLAPYKTMPDPDST